MNNEKSNIWKNHRFSVILISAIVAGSIIGLIMGKDAVVLKPLGQIFINLMFMAIVPLVFINTCFQLH